MFTGFPIAFASFSPFCIALRHLWCYLGEVRAIRREDELWELNAFIIVSIFICKALVSFNLHLHLQ